MNTRIDRIIIYSVLFVCIVFNSCYALATVDSFNKVGYLLLAISILLMIFQKAEKHSSKSKTSRGFLIVILCFVAASIAVNFSYAAFANSIKFVIVVILANLVSEMISFKSFLSVFFRAMEWIAVFAIACWILINIMHFTLPLPELENRNGIIYQVGIIVFQFVGAYQSYPAIGVFWEGGIFSSFLNLAIAFWAAGLVSARKHDIILLVCAIIVSESTAGILLIPLAFSPLLFRKTSRTQPIKLCLIIVAVALIVLNYSQIVSFLNSVNPDLFSKLLYSDMITTSTRIQSPSANMEIFLSAPLFGRGISGAGMEYASIALASTGIDSQTSTSTFLMAAFGLGGVIILFGWVYGIMQIRDLSVWQRIIILLVLIIILNKETHTVTLFLWCLFFYFLSKKDAVVHFEV